MPYQCSGGLAENKCKTSDRLDLFLKQKDGRNQIETWLESHTTNFKYDISNRKLYDNISNGWGCGDEWTIIKKESGNTAWVTSANLLKCIQTKINDEKKDDDLTVRGVCIDGMHKGLVLFNQVHRAQYNEGTGMSISGSITPEYFEKGLKNISCKPVRI